MAISSLLYLQANYAASWYGGYQEASLWVEFVAVALVTLVGIHEVYKANGGAEGSDFIQRFSALSVPIGLKTTLLALAIGQGIYYGFPFVVTPSSFRDPAFVYKFVGYVLALGVAGIFYWRLAVRMRQVHASARRAEIAA